MFVWISPFITCQYEKITFTKYKVSLIFITKIQKNFVDDNGNPTKFSSKNVFMKSSIIAVIITVPSLIALFVGWQISGDLITAAIIATIIHFISMGFSLKISKKIFRKNPNSWSNINYVLILLHLIGLWICKKLPDFRNKT